MPRAKIRQQASYPYFISARCINREWFGIPLETVWDIFSDYLHMLYHGFGFRIHAAVVMNNHYHTIFSTPRANLSVGMNYFQREVSKAIAKEKGRINQIWGAPYYPCLLTSNAYFLNAYKYLYRNPIEVGLARRVEEYKYSTLHGLLGQAHTKIPIEEDTLLFTPQLNLDHVAWLNRGKLDDYLEVKAALRKPIFQFLTNDNTGRSVREKNFLF